MTNPSALLRAIVVFAICLPVAVILGATIAGPFNYTFVGVVGAVVFVLLLPMLLRLHHPLLVLGWNATMIVFFLPGAPGVWMPLTALSLLMSVVQRAMDQEFRFIVVRQVGWPLILLAIVILMTAQATGGIGLRSMGGTVYGGKKYMLLLGAIIGYFALTAQRIPRERANLYIGLFFLAGITSLIGDVLYFQNPALRYLFMFFPPSLNLLGGGSDVISGGVTRLSGLSASCQVVTYFMLARYGIRGLFSALRPWRLALFFAFSAVSLTGGFRSMLILFTLVFCIQFYLEGLHRTRLLPVLLLGLVLVASVTLPFSRQLPLSVQRSLCFLPIPVDISVRAEAEESWDWRIRIRDAVLPEVPHYLLLGKGLAFSREDLDYSMAQSAGTMGTTSADQYGLALSGDYHNGPLSLVIPFGIWGVAAFLWFLAAGIRVLYRNYKYGDENLRTVNTCLFAMFVGKALMFIFLTGGFNTDLQLLIGYLAFNISLNGGVAKRAPASVPEAAEASSFAGMLPRRRSAAGR